MTEAQTGLTLVAKLAEIMAEVERVAKNGRNDFYKYDYATEADIVAAIRGHLAARKVMIFPRVTKWTLLERPGDKGYLTHVDMTFAVVDGETGETMECPWVGCGEDKMDKGLYKAFTGALKYFLLKLFLIPTGDDPEEDDALKMRTASKAKATPKTTTKDAPKEARPERVYTGPVALPSDIGRLWGLAKKTWKATPDEAETRLRKIVLDLCGAESMKDIPADRVGAIERAILGEPEEIV